MDRTFREWVSDVRDGIGWSHLAEPGTPSRPTSRPRPACGAEGGAELIWWFTPTCRKCLRIWDLIDSGYSDEQEFVRP